MKFINEHGCDRYYMYNKGLLFQDTAKRSSGRNPRTYPADKERFRLKRVIMELQEIITEIILGLLLIFISYQVGCKGNFSLIHSYHYGNLDPKDAKVLY